MDKVNEDGGVAASGNGHSYSAVDVEPDLVTGTPMDVDNTASTGTHDDPESRKIALPFNDTPVQNRNKEFRKRGGASGTGRRSSLGMRGRRASSLLENGYSAIPHREVDAAEFYKHIEADGLVEPRRMKQLLVWCGERALCDKPRHGGRGSSAVLGGEFASELCARARAAFIGKGEFSDSLTARAIQDQLLKDFSSRSEFSDWFGRGDAPKVPVVLKPNPRNVEHEEKIAELEAKIQRCAQDPNSFRFFFILTSHCSA
jgi:kinetochore protein Mis13/DSN1